MTDREEEFYMEQIIALRTCESCIYYQEITPGKYECTLTECNYERDENYA